MKKLRIGDSINFKDGRTGVVIDYDDKCYYVRDNNANDVKINKVKDDINENNIINQIDNFLNRLFEKFKSNAYHVERDSKIPRQANRQWETFGVISVQWKENIKFELDIFSTYYDDEPDYLNIRLYLNKTYDGEHAEEVDAPNHDEFWIDIKKINGNSAIDAIYNKGYNLYKNYLESYAEYYETGKSDNKQINEFVNKINYLHDEIEDVKHKFNRLYHEIEDNSNFFNEEKVNQIKESSKEIVENYKKLVESHSKLSSLLLESEKKKS